MLTCIPIVSALGACRVSLVQRKNAGKSCRKRGFESHTSLPAVSLSSIASSLFNKLNRNKDEGLYTNVCLGFRLRSGARQAYSLIEMAESC